MPQSINYEWVIMSEGDKEISCKNQQIKTSEAVILSKNNNTHSQVNFLGSYIKEECSFSTKMLFHLKLY